MNAVRFIKTAGIKKMAQTAQEFKPKSSIVYRTAYRTESDKKYKHEKHAGNQKKDLPKLWFWQYAVYTPHYFIRRPSSAKEPECSPKK